MVRVEEDVAAVVVLVGDHCPVIGATPVPQNRRWTAQAHDLVPGSKRQQSPLFEGQPLHLPLQGFQDAIDNRAKFG